MSPRPSLRELAASERPLVTPTAHDALTARLIERAGFRAMALGGSTMLAARYGLPDLGLAALAEMLETARDIVGATELPCIMDGDDGYGDVKGVARMIRAYEALGVGAVVLEDQVREQKQSGNNRARGVVDVGVMTQKVKAAVETRSDARMLVIARSDAHGLEGLDATLGRCERYLKAGADGLLIPGLDDPEDLRRVGERFRGVHQVIDMIESRASWLKPAELAAMGFSQVVYPNFVMLRILMASEGALRELRGLATDQTDPRPMPDYAAAVGLFKDAVQEGRWAELERRYANA